MESTCATAVVAEPIPIDWTPPKRITAVARPLQVLLVEDDPEAAELAEILLTEDPEDPFRVEWCPNLVDAMNRLAMPGIDVILFDLGLPELTGYRSYRAIEAAASHTIPVVIFTADDRINIRELVLDFGASDYLLKGEIAADQLRRALRAAVQRGWPKQKSRVENQ